MKYLSILLVQVLAICSVTAQSYTNKKGDKQLWGQVSMDQLIEPPFDEWYTKGYTEHESKLNHSDGKVFADVKVKVFIGTWCGDTKKLLPKFLRTWEQLGLSESQLDIIAVHNCPK